MLKIFENLSPYDWYIFILCTVVFVMLTGLFTILFTWITRLLIKHIRAGLEDEQILKEYRKYRKKKKRICIVDAVILLVFCGMIFSAFGFSVYTGLKRDEVTTGIPMWRVVLSSSMSEKHDHNKHLFEHDLNNQFDRFDLVLTEALPPEEELKLYDIVVYEVEEVLLIHRIVGIEEPNDKHPDERWFLLQGDAVPGRDRFPVLYEQMRAIYRGERLQFVGSFVAFLQSPAGYFCVLLILFGIIAIPYLEKKLYKERRKRLQWLMDQGEVDEDGNRIEQKVTVVEKQPLRIRELFGMDDGDDVALPVVRRRCCPLRCPYLRRAHRTLHCMRCPYHKNNDQSK